MDGVLEIEMGSQRSQVVSKSDVEAGQDRLEFGLGSWRWQITIR
jgi:hypothetical protein